MPISDKTIRELSRRLGTTTTTTTVTPGAPAATSGNADTLDNHDSSYFAAASALAAYQARDEKGAVSGYAPLDAAGKVPAANMPTLTNGWTFLRTPAAPAAWQGVKYPTMTTAQR